MLIFVRFFFTLVAVVAFTLIFNIHFFTIHKTSAPKKVLHSWCMEESSTLRDLLTIYRSINQPHVRLDNKTRVNDSNLDMLFNQRTLCDLKETGLSNTYKFYEPSIVLSNQDGCKSHTNSSFIFLVFLVHSKKSNYLRREHLRETWLSQKVHNRESDPTRNISHVCGRFRLGIE